MNNLALLARANSKKCAHCAMIEACATQPDRCGREMVVDKYGIHVARKSEVLK